MERGSGESGDDILGGNWQNDASKVDMERERRKKDEGKSIWQRPHHVFILSPTKLIQMTGLTYHSK